MRGGSAPPRLTRVHSLEGMLGRGRGRTRGGPGRRKTRGRPPPEDAGSTGVRWPVEVTAGTRRHTRPAAAVVVRGRSRRRWLGHEASRSGTKTAGRCGDRTRPATVTQVALGRSFGKKARGQPLPNKDGPRGSLYAAGRRGGIARGRPREEKVRGRQRRSYPAGRAGRKHAASHCQTRTCSGKFVRGRPPRGDCTRPANGEEGTWPAAAR